ncbi:extracellular solute-binding protein [Paenibacillus sp. 1011MAR3C5]|uniref:extracellular solute-binding protein n=1 Tax=Paenibacillus sp. 1011MAR3C5 TaxID=1675787 RepID=UPI0016042945|nr:extracellular solute-binding protein [Paenibacillus sp. 1011MAR3C5]
MPSFHEESPQERKNKLIQMIETEQPDILFLYEYQFKEIASENMLMDLDTLLNQDKDNGILSGMVPVKTEYLRSIGSGKLYGLSNGFYSRALYHNKDLFDRANVPYPRDGMLKSLLDILSHSILTFRKL